MAKELENLISKVKKLKKSSLRIMEKAAVSVNAEMVERIHTQGKDSKGSRIGTYSTKPISVSKKNQPRNTGKTYFSNGYKGFKAALGRQSGFVTLELSGQLRQDLKVKRQAKSVTLGFSNDLNADKSDWMEDKYNKVIWNLTKKEEMIFDKVIQAQINKFLK